MTNNDGTEEIPLSLHMGEGTGDDGKASLSIEFDTDSSFTPDHWIWMMFNYQEEPWFRITFEEAQKIYDRLGLLLGKE